MPKININGVVREMTEDERTSIQNLLMSMPVAEQTDTERMDQIEAALIELAAMIAGGEQDG